MEKSQKKFNTTYLIISLIYILISVLLIIALYKVQDAVIKSFPEYRHAFESEAYAVSSPDMSNRYLTITLPFIFIYLLSLIIFVRKMYIRFISLPLTFLVLIEAFFFYRFLGVGAMYMWMVFFYIPIIVSGLGGTIAGGALLDVFSVGHKEKKVDISNKNNKEMQPK